VGESTRPKTLQKKIYEFPIGPGPPGKIKKKIKVMRLGSPPPQPWGRDNKQPLALQNGKKPKNRFLTVGAKKKRRSDCGKVGLPLEQGGLIVDVV